MPRSITITGLTPEDLRGLRAAQKELGDNKGLLAVVRKGLAPEPEAPVVPECAKCLKAKKAKAARAARAKAAKLVLPVLKDETMDATPDAFGD
jgi:hypothetical protein